MPSDDYNEGFALGEADRLANQPRRDVSSYSDDYQQGYDNGYTQTA
ncbi:MAG: hypothetical protein GY941_04820 [Planctomycetes bacterium]|nr:hypothetical protein [Planctomycetota bacterium]